MPERLFLIDSSSLLFRAYHAIPYLSNLKGLPTNALLGFTNMLLKILRVHKPDYVITVLDSRKPTFRDAIFAEYKANRPETPSDLIMQIPYMTKITEALGIGTIEKEGYEADDLIATIAERMKGSGIMVMVVTGDKDMMQIVSPQVNILDTMKDAVVAPVDVEERLGVPPERVADLLALAGDAIDNIPGIKGIGNKTAVKLIREYGSIEKILENVNNLNPERLRNLIGGSSEQLKLNKKLASLEKSVTIDFTFHKYRQQPYDRDKLRELFRELQFYRLLADIESGDAIETDFLFLENKDQVNKLIESIKGKDIGISISEDLSTLSVSAAPGQARAFAFSPESLNTIFQNASLAYFFDAKKWIKSLRKEQVKVPANAGDIRLLSYLLYPNFNDHEIDSIILRELGKNIPRSKKEGGPLFENSSSSSIMAESSLILEAGRKLYECIRSAEMESLYMNIELPISTVLAEMESRGIRVNRDLLLKIDSRLHAELEQNRLAIFELAGEEFNIDSPKQLQYVLFEKLKLPRKRRTKTGYSTDSEVLQELSGTYALPAKIIQYRTLSKLRSTYIQPLLKFINPVTGRIHPVFHQDVAATGRLSCSDPNLQNIPVRGEDGTGVRSAFIADNGMLLLSADYSQIELRLLAHFSRDENLIQKFRSGADIHTATAARLSGIQEHEVSSEMRRRAKVINYGILYGMGPSGLSRELNIPYEEAESFINEYFLKYPTVREYLDSILDFARRHKHVKTLLGRIRNVPDILSPADHIRRSSERIAVNTVMQGSASDIVKMAMIKIFRRLSSEGVRAWLLLQVHDELLFEFDEKTADIVKLLVKEEMESAVSLGIPLIVGIGTGRNWGEAH